MPDEKYVPAGTEVLAFARYPDLEKAADRTAAKIKEGFMEMGYILKVARDTDILAGSGYMNHEEFAERRYGLDKGTVSRYIRIVERFSVCGNSHVLQEGYKNMGFAKLSLMLHMPDAIAEEISENYSKQEVQAIKDEIDAERAVSDIEVAIEAAGAPQEEGSLLERALRQLGREQPELFGKLCRAVRDSGTDSGRRVVVMDTLAPQGDAVYMVRIPGTGRLMLAISGTAASVTNIRSSEKEKYAVEELMAAVVTATDEVPAAEYGEAAPEERNETDTERISNSAETETIRMQQKEAAPVQPKEKRKESKVIKAAPPKVSAKKTAQTGPTDMEALLHGQMEIMDYPEAYPMGNAICGAPEKQIPDVHYEEIPKADTEVAEKAEYIRMDADGCLERLRKTFSIWNDEIPMDFLEKAHQDAIGLAAAIKGLLDIRRSAEEGSGVS